MLVIEGADNLGKTTLAHRIIERCPWAQYRHMSRPGPGFDFFTDYFPMIRSSFVQDRFHLGAQAWHTVGQTGMTAARLAVIEGWIRSVGGMVIILLADGDWYKERLLTSNRNEMFDVGSILKGNDIYRQLAFEGHADISYCSNWDGDYPNDVWVDNVVNEWSSRREAAALIAQRLGNDGEFYAKTLDMRRKTEAS